MATSSVSIKSTATAKLSQRANYESWFFLLHFRMSHMPNTHTHYYEWEPPSLFSKQLEIRKTKHTQTHKQWTIDLYIIYRTDIYILVGSIISMFYLNTNSHTKFSISIPICGFRLAFHSIFNLLLFSNWHFRCIACAHIDFSYFFFYKERHWFKFKLTWRFNKHTSIKPSIDLRCMRWGQWDL